jgi:hypothetical protein
MAFLGRETDADRVRAERFRQWIHARSPYALASMLFGIVAVLDAFTLVIGIIAGIFAVALAGFGIIDLRRRPQLLGQRLCNTGIILGTVGILASLILWRFVYH